MTFNWQKCDECDRKYLSKEQHDEKYHPAAEETLIIPFEYNAEVKTLLRKGKLQVVKQRPDLLIRITSFNHQPTSVGDIHLKVGQTYKVEEA